MQIVEAQQIMRTALLSLTDQELSNLEWHLKRETPIICGDDYRLWYDGKGGG